MHLPVLLPLVLLGGQAGGSRSDCGDYVKDEQVCEQVVSQANEVDTVPEGHEQRDRARGQ